jgi:SnoaL-like domain
MTPEDLVEMEHIKRLKYAYMRCIDQKLWTELRTLFVDDAVVAYSNGAYTHEGADNIVEWLRSSMGAETFHSSHRIHHPEIELTGPTTATGVWALEDTVIETNWNITIRGAAFYTDEYVKEDGRWKFKFTGYKRSFEELQPRADLGGLKLTASWWATDGRSELPA